MMKYNLRFYKDLLENMSDGIYFVNHDMKITYWNKGAERLSGFSANEVTGSCCSDNVLVHVDTEGRPLCTQGCPLTATMEDGLERHAEVFMRHRSGHRSPVRVRVAPIRDDNGVIIGAVEIFSDNSARMADLYKIEELEQQVFFDPMTGLANRRYLEMTLQSRLEEMNRYGWGLGVLFMDVDHFKRVNDKYGHRTGDVALKMVANTLTHCSRSSDTVGRWGGEEFLAVVVEVNKKSMLTMAERFRYLVEQSSLGVKDEMLRATISIGATMAAPGETVESIVKRADELMYKSKLAGRNCVTSDIQIGVEKEKAS